MPDADPSTLPAKWKIYRAAEHFKEMEAALLRYFQGNPGKLVVEPESTPDAVVARFEAKISVPGRIPLIIGDILQNTRSALDYLVWELVRANGNVPGKHNMFPICSSDDSFTEALKRHGKRPGVLEGIDPDAIAIIKDLQPHVTGNDWEQQSLIYILDKFTNINKHRRVLLTDMRAATPTDLEIVTVDGELWANCSFPTVEAGAKIGPFSQTEKVNMDRKLIAFIAFNEAPVQGREVGTIHNGILKYIHDDVIPKFERFF